MITQIIAMQKKKIDSWQFPQGGIDFGESPLKAAKRELHEEVGIKKKDVKLISSTDKWFKYDVPHEKKESFSKKDLEAKNKNGSCLSLCMM